jgi:hypothetical protein
MKTCGQMGIATGFAAALCKQHQTDPRGVCKEHIDKLKALCAMEGDATETEIEILPAGQARRASDHGSKYAISDLPDTLKPFPSVVVPRGSFHQPAPGFTFQINSPAEVYIAVHQRGGYTPPAGWEKTNMTLRWFNNVTDAIYRKNFAAGTVHIPGHTGMSGPNFGVPHMAFVKGSDVSVKLTE